MVSRNCEHCGTAFEARRRDARFCSAKCRKQAWTGAPLIVQPPALPGPVERETRVILTRLGVSPDDDVARAALRVAATLDDPATPAGALPGLSRVLPETIQHLRDTYGGEACEENNRPWLER